MNEPTFAEMFRSAQQRFGVRRPLTIDEAKTVVRGWLDEMRRDLDGWSRHTEVDSEQSVRADQLEEAMRLLRQSALGMLLAVETAQPVKYKEKQASSSPLDWLMGPSKSEPPPPAPPPAVVQPQGLVNHVLHMCEALDATLEAARPRPPVPVVQPWGADTELVRLLHDLLSARQTGHGAKALNRLNQLVEQLRERHEIEVLAYDENVSQYFALDPSPGHEDAEIRTVRPALRWRQQVVAVGEATRRPAGNSAPSGELPRISERGQ